MRFSGFRISEKPPPVPTMPRGLVELMEGLSRDVLKNNPTEVYEFCATHMQKLLEIRDGPTKKKPLSLEQKILKAQEKVKQRAEQRRLMFDRQLQVQSMQDPDDNTIPPEVKEPVTDTTLLSTLKPPIHHDQLLTDASEVEISLEPFRDTTTAQDNQLFVADKTNDIDVADATALTENEPRNVSHVADVVDILALKQMIKSKPDSVKMEPISDTSDYVSETDVEDKETDGHVEIQSKTDTTSMNKTQEHIVLNNPNLPLEENCEPQQEQKISSTEFDINTKNDTLAGEAIATEIDPEQNNTTAVDNKKITSGHADTAAKSMTHQNFDESTAEGTSDGGEVKNTQDGNDVTPIKPDTLVAITQKVLSKDLNVVDQMPTLNESLTHQDDHQRNEHLKADANCESDPENKSNVVKITAVDNKSDEIDKLTPVVDEKGNNDLLKPLETATVDIKYEEGLLHENKEDNEDQHKLEDNSVNITAINHKLEEIGNLVPAGDEKGNGGVDTVLKENKLGTLKENIGSDVGVIEGTQKDQCKIEDINSTEFRGNNGESNEIDKVEDAKDFDGQTTLIAEIVEKGNVDNDSAIEDDDSKVQEAPNDSAGGNQSSMDLETAAVTIQKVFRTFLFKSRASTFDDSVNDTANMSDDDSENKEEREYVISSSNLNMERRPLGITRMDTVLQTVNEEKSLSLSTDDSSTLSSAATTIQAHVRGFLVRNRLNSNKTVSTSSLVNSNTSLDNDIDHHKNKTVLNIHIVPEGGNFSRDESILTSMDLSLDASPPSSINLHPLGYDKSERRKLKREDAIQSISPPSNNSGKLSEESVKDVIINDITDSQTQHNMKLTNGDNLIEDTDVLSRETSPTESNTPITVINAQECFEETSSSASYSDMDVTHKRKSFTKMSSDEMDVVTPFLPSDDRISTPLPTDINAQKLEHSGEFHDMVLPTKVSRYDTAIVREFKNVFVYFLLWNHS